MKKKKYVQTKFFDIKGYFERSVFEILRVDCNRFGKRILFNQIANLFFFLISFNVHFNVRQSPCINHWLGAYRTYALYSGQIFVRFNDLEDVFT